jgi:DNA-binding transcriptional LysR family regulator
MLDLAQLRSFVQVAERGTVAAAARSLGYTPPAVSQHLGKLEDELGSALFDRVGGRLHLTAAGHALLPIAHQIADLTETARAATARPVDRPHFRVAGFASAIAAVLIPQLDVINVAMSVDIIESEDGDALRDLALGAVDLVLVQEYDDEPIQRDRRFAYTAALTDHLRLVLHRTMSPSTRVADLAASRWLINGRGTRCAAATEKLLASRGIRPDITATVNDNATLLALVAAGHGVTIVPSLVLDHAAVDVVVSDEDLGVQRTVYAVTRDATHAAVTPLLDLITGPAEPDQR